MGVFHIFYIVQILPNRAKRLKSLVIRFTLFLLNHFMYNVEKWTKILVKV